MAFYDDDDRYLDDDNYSQSGISALTILKVISLLTKSEKHKQ